MKTPEPVTLEGTHVRLEPLAAEHLPTLATAYEEDTSPYLYLGYSPSVLGWEAWLAEALGGQARGVYLPWATVLCATGAAIGSTRFGDIEPSHGRVEIGWTWLGKRYQHTAANTEAKLLQLRHAFDDLGATRVAFKTDGRNEGSQRALEAIGATREGVLRRHMRMPDGYIRDTVYYSILAEEWPDVRRRLEARLEGKISSSTSSDRA
jgi:RimJ/RimL family protein N-acetyltransferase